MSPWLPYQDHRYSPGCYAQRDDNQYRVKRVAEFPRDAKLKCDRY
ncbi:hypothetical protein [Bremerella alba]|nr:hypothetical protein [Bremerella alba]